MNLLRNLILFWKYIKYRFTAKTRYAVHSPFLFAFIEEVLRDKGNYYAYDKIEEIRHQLLRDHKEIDVVDLGAGSKKMKQSQRKISSIAKNSLMPRKQAQLMHRLVMRMKPENVIELGTSLGITTLYLSSAHTSIPVYTIEGSPAIHHYAMQLFHHHGGENIRAIEGNFDEQLTIVLKQIVHPGMVIIDGNHQYEPTMRYFNQVAEVQQNDTFIVFDDIHWSEEMEKAWNEIIQDERVSLSIDLFFQGIVFFRKESKKEHYVIQF